jgi:hypothetical protein
VLSQDLPQAVTDAAMSGIEAAGDIATGALFGRALETSAGEGHGVDHGLCLNCGTKLIGPHCYQCGQAGHVHRTLGSIVHELAHGVFHFEGKIWRTLPMLILHPGALTRRYIAGERARFVSPLALFLFCVFLMFAVIHSVAGDFDPTRFTPASQLQTENSIDAQIKTAQANLAAEEKKPGADKDDIAAAQKTIAALNTARAAIAKPGGHAEIISANVNTGWKTLDEGIDRVRENPGLALYKLQTNAYKYSWLLIPISVPFVALLFLWRRRYGLYDHTIFVIYSLDFMTLLVTVESIAGALGVRSSVIALTSIGIPPIHIYKQLRGAYQLKRFSALWRTMFLTTFAFCALLLFALLLVTMGLME